MQRAKTPMGIEAEKIPQRDSFRYLYSKISNDGEIEEDVVNPSTYRNSSVFRKQVCTIVKQNNH